MKTKLGKVLVGMSGGVDSSVAAALLSDQGWEVTGIMMRLWSDDALEAENRVSGSDSISIAQQVASQLNIPFHIVDVRQAHKEIVVDQFINDYAQGATPNPCPFCNRLLRWELLLKHAQFFNASFVSTGHYARIKQEQNTVRLLVAKDPVKDQSYALHLLNQFHLSHTLLPLGELTKKEVRQIARERGLISADRSDSQDLCFLGSEDYRTFLVRHAPQIKTPGPILTQDGKIIGSHDGLAFFTIGQRKGLGISNNEPLYVIEKNREQNALIVGPLESLGKDSLKVNRINWVSGSPPPPLFRSGIKIRSTAPQAPATVKMISADIAEVKFDQPLRDITAGQAAVFYQDEVCLGGGTIL